MTTEPNITEDAQNIEITVIDLHAPYGRNDNERIDTIEDIPDNTEYVRVWYSTGYSVRYTPNNNENTTTIVEYFDDDSNLCDKYRPRDDVASCAKYDATWTLEQLNEDTPDEAALRTVGIE